MEKQQINPVSWFEIYVDDMERAKDFYQKVLQVEISSLPNPEGIEIQMEAFPMEMNAAGASGALVKMDGYGPSNRGTIIYFESEDCAVEESRVEAAGGKVLKSKTSIGEYGFMVEALDSEGNTFGIHSNK